MAPLKLNGIEVVLFVIHQIYYQIWRIPIPPCMSIDHRIYSTQQIKLMWFTLQHSQMAYVLWIYQAWSCIKSVNHLHILLTFVFYVRPLHLDAKAGWASNIMINYVYILRRFIRIKSTSPRVRWNVDTVLNFAGGFYRRKSDLCFIYFTDTYDMFFGLKLFEFEIVARLVLHTI